MRSLKPFFKTVGQSFNPNSYQHLSTREFRDAFHYLLSVMLVCFLLISLIALPTISQIPKAIDGELSKFSKFSLSAEIEMTEPIVFTEEDPQIIIDTTGEFTNISKETLVITNDTIFYRPFLRTKTYDTDVLKDVVENRGMYSFLIWVLVVLTLPMILVISFALYLAKYLLIILGAALVALIATYFMKYEVKIKHLLKIGAYAATPMILLDLLTVPFLDAYGIPYVLFGFYFVVGIAMNAERRIVHHGRKDNEF